MATFRRRMAVDPLASLLEVPERGYTSILFEGKYWSIKTIGTGFVNVEKAG